MTGGGVTVFGAPAHDRLSRTPRRVRRRVGPPGHRADDRLRDGSHPTGSATLTANDGAANDVFRPVDLDLEQPGRGCRGRARPHCPLRNQAPDGKMNPCSDVTRDRNGAALRPRRYTTACDPQCSGPPAAGKSPAMMTIRTCTAWSSICLDRAAMPRWSPWATTRRACTQAAPGRHRRRGRATGCRGVDPAVAHGIDTEKAAARLRRSDGLPTSPAFAQRGPSGSGITASQVCPLGH